MAVLAMLYGFLSRHSIWYPINLLSAVVYSQPIQLRWSSSPFHPGLLIVATPSIWSPRCWSAFFTASCCRCFRAARFCLAALSRPSCGRVCCTRVSGSSIR